MVDDKVTMTVTMQGDITAVDISKKPDNMLQDDYDLKCLEGTWALVSFVAKEIATEKQDPKDMVDKIAYLAKAVL